MKFRKAERRDERLVATHDQDQAGQDEKYADECHDGHWQPRVR